MKKFTSLFLAIMLCLALCACSDGNDVSENKSETTTEPFVYETTTAAAVGSKTEKLSFESEDIYGNKVSDSIFKSSKLTVINVWGTFCSPCIAEMPYLAELSDEYNKADVQFVGLVIDAADYYGNIDDSIVEDARSIAEKTKADYTHILPMNELLVFSKSFFSVPTTVFVNSEGELVSSSVVGSRDKEEWKSIIDSVLEGVSK